MPNLVLFMSICEMSQICTTHQMQLGFGYRGNLDIALWDTDRTARVGRNRDIVQCDLEGQMLKPERYAQNRQSYVQPGLLLFSWASLLLPQNIQRIIVSTKQISAQTEFSTIPTQRKYDVQHCTPVSFFSPPTNSSLVIVVQYLHTVVAQ